MSWPLYFRDTLITGSYPLALRLEIIPPATGEGIAGTVPGWYAASTGEADSYATILIRNGYRVNLGSSAIVPVSWQYVEGAWSLTVQVPEGRRRNGRNYSALASMALRRGAMVRLSIGRVGQSASEFRSLKLGRIYSVKTAGHPRTYRVEVWDIHTAFRSRMTATSVTSQQRAKLFYGTAGATYAVATSGYTVGASIININDTAADRFTLESGGAGVARVTSNSSGDFLIKYTGIGATSLTGVVSSGSFGTTAADASIGNAVVAVCLLEGHPVDILHKILTSTGLGTNGDFDVYPRSWGLGVPAEMIDAASFNQAKRILSVTGGTYDFTLLVDAEQADPSAYIESVLRPAGIWFCVREGQIVCRVARDMHTAGTQRQQGNIFEQDLLGVPVVEWYPTDQPETYFRSLIQDSGTDVTFTRASTSTLPVREEVVYNLLGVFNGATSAHITRVTDDLKDRVGPWAHMLPEYIDVHLRGLRSYAPGDIVAFTCGQAYGRLDGTRDGYNRRPVMVIREAMDLNTNSTKLTLATLPISLQEDGGAT